jgi:hypothetical protein
MRVERSALGGARIVRPDAGQCSAPKAQRYSNSSSTA